MNELPISVAISGASGSLYVLRLLQVLLLLNRKIDLTISQAAVQVFDKELNFKLDLSRDVPLALLEQIQKLPEIHGLSECIKNSHSLRFFRQQDFSAGIASGSYRTAGMVICPCSMGTLSAIAHGLSGNLMQRAADVHLKERRRLILVPRETPLGSIQLENMKRIADVGGIILPAMPGFYHQPQSMMDLVDFIVQRICDHLNIEIKLQNRWGES